MENVREERQEVRFVGQRKIDGQVRSRMAKRKKNGKGGGNFESTISINIKES